MSVVALSWSGREAGWMTASRWANHLNAHFWGRVTDLAETTSYLTFTKAHVPIMMVTFGLLGRQKYSKQLKPPAKHKRFLKTFPRHSEPTPLQIEQFWPFSLGMTCQLLCPHGGRAWDCRLISNVPTSCYHFLLLYTVYLFLKWWALCTI